MGYRVRQTGDYIASETELRRCFANKLSPRAVISSDVLNAIDVDPVLEGAQATGGSVYQYSQFSGLENINGQWFTKYILGPVFTDYTDADGNVVTAQQQENTYKAHRDSEKAAQVRSERDRKLSDSDWTQVEDSPVDKEVWKTYRQALRDVPSQQGFPWNVVWPEQP